MDNLDKRDMLKDMFRDKVVPLMRDVHDVWSDFEGTFGQEYESESTEIMDLANEARGKLQDIQNVMSKMYKDLAHKDGHWLEVE